MSKYLNKRMNGIDSAELIKTLIDDELDFILIDPPYDFDRDTMLWWDKKFHRVCKHGYIAWSPPDNQWLPKRAKQILFWEKPISTKNTSRRYSRFVEMLFVHGDTKWRPGRHWSQYTNVFKDLVDDTYKHPFRKPPSVIKRLLLNHTDPGDIVGDFFAGSHVVADVCEEIGRSFISIELVGLEEFKP